MHSDDHRKLFFTPSSLKTYCPIDTRAMTQIANLGPPNAQFDQFTTFERALQNLVNTGLHSTEIGDVYSSCPTGLNLLEGVKPHYHKEDVLNIESGSVMEGDYQHDLNLILHQHDFDLVENR